MGQPSKVDVAIEHFRSVYSRIDPATRLIIAGALVYVGWHMVHASFHIFAIGGLTPAGAFAGTGALIFGLTLMASGTVMGIETVDSAVRGRRRRRRRDGPCTTRSGDSWWTRLQPRGCFA